MATPCRDSQSVDDVETQPLANRSDQTSRNDSSQLACIMLVGVWIFVSCFVIMFNKWIFTSGGFPYPLALNALQMYCCFFVFGSIRKLAPAQLREIIMPDANVVIPASTFVKNLMLTAILYAITLGAGNLAYLFSSVALIQMMKTMNPVYTSLAAFAIGMEVPTVSHVIIVGIVVVGVIIATSSAAEMSMAGVALQSVSSAAEGCRLALMQLVTSRGLKLDPVTTIYHISLTSALMLTIATIAIEWPLELEKLRNPWILLINCFCTIFLNLVVVLVIRKTSAVIFTLCGIMKNIGLIAGSCVVFQTPLTLHQCQGYATTLLGLALYKAYKDNLEYFKQKGFIEGMKFVIKSSVDRGKFSLRRR